MKGEDRIRRYLERAFYGVEKNEKVREEMEALLGELLEKYQSLTAQGYEPEAAYQSVISGIGDIFELVDGIAQEAQTGRPPLGGPADLRQTDGFGSGWKSSPRMLEAAPYVAAAGLLLLWGGSLLSPAGPRARALTPMLMLALGIGVGAAVLWIWMNGDRKAVRSRAPRQRAGRTVQAAVWCAAALGMFLAASRPHLERLLWLIPLAALAVHQMIAAWLAYEETKERRDFHG